MPNKVDTRIEGNPALAPLVDRASRVLETVLRESAGLVTAEWSLAEDEHRRPVIDLTLSDFTGSVTGQLTPEELGNPGQLEVRLNRLWADLLQVRSHKQVERLKQLVAALED